MKCRKDIFIWRMSYYNKAICKAKKMLKLLESSRKKFIIDESSFDHYFVSYYEMLEWMNNVIYVLESLEDEKKN